MHFVFLAAIAIGAGAASAPFAKLPSASAKMVALSLNQPDQATTLPPLYKQPPAAQPPIIVPPAPMLDTPPAGMLDTPPALDMPPAGMSDLPNVPIGESPLPAGERISNPGMCTGPVMPGDMCRGKMTCCPTSPQLQHCFVQHYSPALAVYRPLAAGVMNCAKMRF